MKYAVLVETKEGISNTIVKEVNESPNGDKDMYDVGEKEGMFIPANYVDDTKEGAESILEGMRSADEELPMNTKDDLHLDMYTQPDQYFRWRQQRDGTSDKSLEEPMIIEEDQDQLDKKHADWEEIFMTLPELADAIIETIGVVGPRKLKVRKSPDGETTYVAFRTSTDNYTISVSHKSREENNE